MFRAMMALTAAQVRMAENFTYWAYIPHPPLNTLVTWSDVAVPVYINDTNWLPGPYDPRGAIKPEEEGTVLPFYQTGGEAVPICIGHNDHCLKPQNRAWLVLVRNETTKNQKDLYLLSGTAFMGREVRQTTLPKSSLPLCSVPVANSPSSWLKWKTYQGPELWQPNNTTPHFQS